MAATTAVRSRPRKQQMASFEIEQSTPLQDGSNSSTNQHKKLQVLPANITTISYALDVYSHPLVLESKSAFKALLILPLILWWIAVFSGMRVYEGLPKGERVYHSMLWFDRGVLRPAGPLLPFIVLILRALIHAVDHVLKYGVAETVTAAKAAVTKVTTGKGGVRRPVLKLGSLFTWCLVIYVSMAVARVGIYLTHWFLLSNRYLEYHVVSDHIFLAATMVICLHTEMICLMSDILRVLRDPRQTQNTSAAAAAAPAPGLDVLLTVLFVMAVFLYVFTAADMYYTARYYHFPLESFSTTVLVFVMFQLPMIVWLLRQRRYKAEE